MPPSKTYSGVTLAVWECMKADATGNHGTVFDPETGTKGTATTKQMGQTVVMAFDLDFEAETLTYTIVSKGPLVPERAIWNGVQKSVEGCQRKVVG